ncbi:lantibiotic dehydratase [Chitinophaga sp.]|uniref:lantibiotic dehydratase n=1 Tax=Chitinophaga sp. TaxID=1869181 RepID=UPI0031E4103C
MKDYVLEDFYLLRAPARPIENILYLNAQLDKGDMTVVKQLFSDPHFLEAIYISSRDLYLSLQRWLEGEELSPKKLKKLLTGLHKYYSRMCTRSTPFGLFAGSACGTILEGESGVHFDADKVRKVARFDMSYINELTERLAKHTSLRGQIRYYVNNTLYRIGYRYLYVEYTMKAGKRSHTLSALTASDYIDMVLALARDGVTIDTLTNEIRKTIADEQAISNFIHGLIQSQVLTHELTPAIANENFVPALIQRLQELGQDQFCVPLEESLQLMKDISLEGYQAVEEKAGSVIPIKDLEVLQMDMFFQMQQNNINKQVISELAAASYELTSAIPSYLSPLLETFMKKFSERYEQQEVPLVMALDPDVGIGYGLATTGNVEYMPLIEQLSITPPAGADMGRRKTAQEELAEKKLRSWWQSGETVVTITAEDLAMLRARSNTPERPVQNASCYLFGSLLASSCEAIDRGAYRFLATQLHAPSAAKLISRFAHGDEILKEKMLAITQREQDVNKERVMAEIAYVPEGHFANLSLRPTQRAYEIAFLSQSSVEPAYRIDVNDILVSVRGNRIVIRSKRLNKEILPCHTNAFNTDLAQPFVRFLNDLQSMYVNVGFRWQWYNYTLEPHLPRVEYKNIILGRERWYLARAADSSVEVLAASLDAFLEKYQVPRYVILSEGDNELLIDTTNEFCKGHVIQAMRKGGVTFMEHVFTPENCFIKDEKGSYSNEIIVPMSVTHPVFEEKPAKELVDGAVQCKRTFGPGSEWMYFKIYSGFKTMDLLLRDIIQPLVQEWKASGAIDKWFYIRYNDPESHIRLRLLKGTDIAGWHSIVEKLNGELEPLIESGQVTRCMMDTYQRELERYGALTMEDSESIFYYDSEAVINMLDHLQGQKGEQLRWQMALYNVDQLLDDFKYDLHRKRDFMKQLRNYFFREFSGKTKESAIRFDQSLSNKYRNNKALIQEVFVPAKRTTQVLAAMESYNERREQHAATIESICNKVDGDRLDGLLNSYIHMTMNRTFLARHRIHELVIYDTLYRYYDSLVAMGRQLSLSINER